MNATDLFEGRSYNPTQVRALVQAFASAWEHIAPSVPNSSSAIEATRTKLATLIMGLAKLGITIDQDELAAEVAKLISEEADTAKH